MEPFTLVEETQRPGPFQLFDDVVDLASGKTADHDLCYLKALRDANPDTIGKLIIVDQWPRCHPP